MFAGRMPGGNNEIKMTTEKTKPGKVYIIGAGRGSGAHDDQGARAWGGRVVVYDNLVNEELLAYAPAGARVIYAGKEEETTR
jgi:siroheme synthase